MTASRSRARGFTLVELLIVMVVMSIVATYAFMKNSSPASYTLLSQGEVLASNLRHAQALASTWSRSLRVGLSAGANGTYSVACATSSSSSPCNSSPVLDPTTGNAFSVSVQNGVSISGPATLTFDSSGKPSGSGSYALTYDGATVTVFVAPVTGFVTVTQ